MLYALPGQSPNQPQRLLERFHHNLTSAAVPTSQVLFSLSLRRGKWAANVMGTWWQNYFLVYTEIALGTGTGYALMSDTVSLRTFPLSAFWSTS